ncbi:hypothetical protein [Mycolicibacterium chlorophenolicum]|uniref:4Fe-4S Wbl-type domain-containing protein n=1 Tax=Mycolicibacterium chlorophenolicum TaxID=37916 RepID=A0A0J6WJX9_9MYCO|nr:hypothetical protein [Mycolicibacterium chlorophenolicum]KMO82303.1 hypothetical protein MCHLDSM_01455 [Mycolicibacterium chlorophenolicum]
MNWEDVTGLLRGIPDLPGARCKGKAQLFEATIGEYRHRAGRPPTSDELGHARRRALSVCRACPALSLCRAYLDGLPLAQRPRGVVAGLIIKSSGRPWNTVAPEREAGR